MNDEALSTQSTGKPDRLVTIRELSRLWGIQHYYLSGWFHAGKVPGVIRVGLRDRRDGRPEGMGVLESSLDRIRPIVEQLEQNRRRLTETAE